MPSRSKIFSLPKKLRSRSRSVAGKKGGRRLEDDGEEHQPSRTMASPPSSAVAASVTVSDRAKSSPASAQQAVPVEVQRAVLPTAQNNPPYTSKSPTAAHPKAASATNNNNNGVSFAMPTTTSSSSPPLSRATDSSRDTNTSVASSIDENDQFITAFTRSPPSFDKFDSDILSDNGVFPQPTQSRSYSPVSPTGLSHSHSNSYSYSSVGPSYSGGHDSHSHGQQPSVGLNGSYLSDEPHSIGPNGILWGDSSVIDDGEDENVNMVYSQDCYSDNADPPAILMLEEDDLIDDEEADDGHPGTRNNRGATDKEESHAQNKEQGSEWFDPFAKSEWNNNNEPKNKNRRLVSPSPSPAKTNKPLNDVGNDDLAAWGGVTVNEKESQENFNNSENVFGSNFFTGFDNDRKVDEFDGNDGFGAVDAEDAFFGDSWMDVNAGHGDDVSKQTKGSANKESDPWGEASFAENTSFNYSMSNEESKQGPLIEEKKDDDNFGQDTARNNNDPPAAPQALKVWDDQASKNAAASHQSKQHPLKASSRQQEKHEVVVTFDKRMANNNRPPPSIIDERKVSHGSSAVVSTHRNHRRLNSHGSQSSRRNKKGGGSVCSSHSKSRNKKSGGSVGSNSSAVDQILEQYRQKRRLAKDKVSARVTPSGASSVHSGVYPGSVHSGSQFSTPGSSSGAGVSVVGNGSAGSGRHTSHRRNPSGGSTSHHRRNPSGGSTSHHRRNPSGGSSGHHRRNPSNESILRIIDNLETAAAATAVPTSRGKTATTHRTPSPAVGKYYPPNANGFVGVGGMGSGGDDAADQFLLANIEATIGPRGVAPDMESLSGRSVRSHRSQSQPRPRSSSNNRHGSSRLNRSPTRNNNRRISADTSVDSRASRNSRTSKASRNSFRTYQSTRSALTTMSKETQSVANDLFRLEAQLAEVARQQEQEEHLKGDANRATTTTSPPSVENITYSTSGELSAHNNMNNTLGAEPVPRPTPFQITAPPGKLGILLSNKSGQKGPTHVSAVRSESVLAGKVHVGDIFMSIDGEDVTRMNSKEITNIMARNAEFERVLRFRPLVLSSVQRQEWI